MAQGAKAIAVAGDIAQEPDCRRLALSAADQLGRIDALVNCAATTRFVSMTELDALDATDFERIFRVNTVGTYQVIRAAVPYLRRNGGGAIVNVSSIAGAAGTGSSYAYAASKGALNTLTIALARNLAPQIRVNAVAPGMIEGRWLREGLGEDGYRRAKERFMAESALGRICTPEDIADAIGWLIAGTQVVTGQVLVVDAGATLGKPPAVVER